MNRRGDGQRASRRRGGASPNPGHARARRRRAEAQERKAAENAQRRAEDKAHVQPQPQLSGRKGRGR